MTIPMAIPVKRGCGVRIEGGLYIVTDASIEELTDYIDMSDANIEGKLYIFPKPYPALVNLKPFRGYRGFDKKRFFRDLLTEDAILNLKKYLPFSHEKFQKFLKEISKSGKVPVGKGRIRKRPRLHNCYYAHPEESNAWLHWMGNEHYTIEEFIKEAELIGVSRRVPEKMLRKMKWGDTIFLASKEKKLKSPVIFGYFKLERIQGVKVDMEELPEHLRDRMRYQNMDF